MANLLQYLRANLDEPVRGDAVARVSELQGLRNEAAKQAVAARAERYNGRDTQSLSPEVARLYYQLKDQAKAEGDAAAIQKILSTTAGALEGQGVANPARGIAAALSDPDKAAVLNYLAQQGGPGLQARGYDALIGVNQALADQGLKGKLSRGALYSGIGAGGVMGATAGAQGLMALIDYLQNPAPEDTGA